MVKCCLNIAEAALTILYNNEWSRFDIIFCLFVQLVVLLLHWRKMKVFKIIDWYLCIIEKIDSYLDSFVSPSVLAIAITSYAIHFLPFTFTIIFGTNITYPWEDSSATAMVTNVYGWLEVSKCKDLVSLQASREEIYKKFINWKGIMKWA